MSLGQDIAAVICSAWASNTAYLKAAGRTFKIYIRILGKDMGPIAPVPQPTGAKCPNYGSKGQGSGSESATPKAGELSKPSRRSYAYGVSVNHNSI